MPIYEYICNSCGKDFERLIYGSQSVDCPECKSKDIKKKLSAFGMSGVQKPFAGSPGCSSSCSKSSCSSCK